jgi:hypothetical protein
MHATVGWTATTCLIYSWDQQHPEQSQAALDLIDTARASGTRLRRCRVLLLSLLVPVGLALANFAMSVLRNASAHMA